MPNPPEFASTRRSAVLETLDDLAAMIDDIRAQMQENGRSETLDVMFMSTEGGAPGDDSWNPGRHLADLRAQADLGVNGNKSVPPGDTPEAVFTMVRRYADDVVGQIA